jgi:hypothetical protein
MRSAKSVSEVLHQVSRAISPVNLVRGSVQRTNYGAEISLTDGRTCSLWEFAVSGCVLEAAVDWAKRHGAIYVTVEQ